MLAGFVGGWDSARWPDTPSAASRFQLGDERQANVLPSIAPILINLRTALNVFATRDLNRRPWPRDQ